MKKKKTINKNYLDKIPVHKAGLDWSYEENGLVTLHIENTGFANKIAQKLFRKPRISHIHLDETGSFIWPLIDADKSISDFGEPMKQHFGDAAEPLYERLATFFQILESYGFITFKE